MSIILDHLNPVHRKVYSLISVGIIFGLLIISFKLAFIEHSNIKKYL
ncbi:MAG: hypothetical protein JWQ85_947 [Mucilaginibacter sp.]|nr:hypothetical protein [Mucilaginibacter sp.]